MIDFNVSAFHLDPTPVPTPEVVEVHIENNDYLLSNIASFFGAVVLSCSGLIAIVFASFKNSKCRVIATPCCKLERDLNNSEV